MLTQQVDWGNVKSGLALYFGEPPNIPFGALALTGLWDKKNASGIKHYWNSHWVIKLPHKLS